MSRKPTAPDLADIVKILDHERTRVGWLVQVVDGKIERRTRIAVQYPRDGAGRLRVAVTDWTGRDGDPIQFIGTAGGYGYDKLTAALDGATIGGVVVGDHGGRGDDSRPTWRALIDGLRREGTWDFLGL